MIGPVSANLGIWVYWNILECPITGVNTNNQKLGFLIQRPTLWLLTLQAIVLFLAFTVRYNALFYPLVGAVAILLTRRLWWVKIVSLAGSVVLIALFMLFTSNQYKTLSGVREFSPFTGWQIANNAMYAYRYVDEKDVKRTPAPLVPLDNTVRHYFDTTRDVMKHPEAMLVASTVYMWDPKSPLQKFMAARFKNDSTSSILKRWSSMAPLYAQYGRYLIRQYPLIYFQHYLWPNTLKYFAPPGEFLDTYNMGRDTVSRIAQSWFNYKTNKVRTAFKDLSVNTLDYMPIVSGIMNLAFLIGFIFVWMLGGTAKSKPFFQPLLLIALLWIFNLGFSVFASPITLRYQLFMILVITSVSLVLVDYIFKIAYQTKAVVPT
jgi:hypothetical protein